MYKRQVSENPQTSHIPIVLLTHRDQAPDILQGLGAGAHAFMIKGSSETELLSRVKRLLKAQEGKSTESLIVDNLHSRLVLTHDRKDILKLLYRTLTEQASFEAMAFLISGEDGSRPLVMVSAEVLPPAAASAIAVEASGTFALFSGTSLDETQLTVESLSLSDHMHKGQTSPTAAVKIPLQVDNEFAGIMALFTFGEMKQLEDRMRFFFDVGVEAARAIRKVSLESA